MQTQATKFTDTQRAAIEALREALSASTAARVVVEYDSTDCDQHWAALCVEELPAGSWGDPGPLVSVLTGNGVPGGVAVISAAGVRLFEGGEFGEAIKAARFAGVREYRAMRKGTLVAA